MRIASASDGITSAFDALRHGSALRPHALAAARLTEMLRRHALVREAVRSFPLATEHQRPECPSHPSKQIHRGSGTSQGSPSSGFWGNRCARISLALECGKRPFRAQGRQIRSSAKNPPRFSLHCFLASMFLCPLSPLFDVPSLDSMCNMCHVFKEGEERPLASACPWFSWHEELLCIQNYACAEIFTWDGDGHE